MPDFSHQLWSNFRGGHHITNNPANPATREITSFISRIQNYHEEKKENGLWFLRGPTYGFHGRGDAFKLTRTIRPWETLKNRGKA